MLVRTLTCLVAAVSLNGCEAPKPSDLEGSYTLRTDELQESLELKSGGVFAQQITIDGRTFTTTGEWLIEKPRGLKLRDFLVRFDTSSGKIIDPPQKYGAYFGYWNPSRKRIVFDDEGKYFLDRVMSGEKPPR